MRPQVMIQNASHRGWGRRPQATSPPHPDTAAPVWPQYARLFFSVASTQARAADWWRSNGRRQFSRLHAGEGKVAPTQARAAGIYRHLRKKFLSRLHAGEGRRERNDSSAPNRCRTHAVEVLQDPAGRRHRCEPATNAVTFSQHDDDAPPRWPSQEPRWRRSRSPQLHGLASSPHSSRGFSA